VAVDEAASLSRTPVESLDAIEHVALESKADEERAAEALAAGGTVLLERGWEIIPVENLLAVGEGTLYAACESAERARLAAEVLERGVDGVVLEADALDDLRAVREMLHAGALGVELLPARVTAIKPSGMGHRVCVDTLSRLDRGAGLLTGNSSGFTFLVHGETESNPYVASRPFRVNAGAVHAYVSLPGDRTKYLEELGAGDEVLVVGHDGATRPAVVGRSKVEQRPMLLIEAEVLSDSGRAQGTVFLQNAETIRLVRPGGEPVSVVSLKPGDEVLVRVDQAGRHFGRRVAEDIEEK
jgi:3-dehydroquinate synthase II